MPSIYINDSIFWLYLHSIVYASDISDYIRKTGSHCKLWFISVCLTAVYTELNLPSWHLDNSSPHSWHCSTQYHLVQSQLIGQFSLEWSRKPRVVGTCMVTCRTYLLSMSPSKFGLGSGHNSITIVLGNLTSPKSQASFWAKTSLSVNLVCRILHWQCLLITQTLFLFYW